MHTGRSVTVSRGGAASQKNFLGGKKLEKKIWIKKKFELKKFELKKILN